jgi:hypothetical protein
MRAFVCAGAGFLLAVLWFDLIFDVQMLRRSTGEAPDEAAALASISGYYRRATTEARPMNRLVAAVMLATLVAIVAELARDAVPAWVGWLSLALALAPISLAARRTVPNAVRLGSRVDPLEQQADMARSVGRDHLFCLAAIAALLVVQLAWA